MISSARKALRHSGPCAVALGVGVLSVGGEAAADCLHADGVAGSAAVSSAPDRAARPPGGVALRLDGERVLISQDGGPFEDLALGDTGEARHLRDLLAREVREAGTDAVAVRPLQLADGGASQPWVRSATPVPQQGGAVNEAGQAQGTVLPAAPPGSSDATQRHPSWTPDRRGARLPGG